MKTLQVLTVMGGGAFGALARYLLWFTLENLRGQRPFPLATLLANLIGSFLLGLVAFSSLSPYWRLAIATGFLGALTTFSTFELDLFRLFDEGRYGLLGMYLASNLLLGFMAIILGRNLALKLN
ncbi:MAG: fluoride efflux transporter CrcB [Deinococcales bacterium]